MRARQTALLLGITLLGGQPAMAAEPEPLSPALVASWSRILTLQAQPADSNPIFAWEGTLPGSWKASLTDRLSPLSTPTSLLNVLGSSPLAPADLALGLLATTDIATTAAVLLRLSAKQWANSAAEQTLAATLGPLNSPQEAATVQPALLLETPAPPPASPPPTFLLEPIRLSSEGKQ
ncbi:MAG: hypothetical protein U1F76_14520 [Candidatus Competibacteraceae bacterium]